jgi:integrase
MVSIYKRGRTWYADLRDHGGGRVSLRTADETVARLKASQMERDAYLGVTRAVDKAATGPTLGEAWNRAYRMHWAGDKSIRTVEMRERAIYASIPATTPLAQVAGLIDKLVADLQAKGNTLTTVNRNMCALRTVLKLAVEWGMLAAVPKLPTFKEGDRRTFTFSPKDEARLIEGFMDANKPAMANLVIVLIDTGARLGEVVARDKVAHEGNMMRLWGTKNGGERSVPLTPRAQGALSAWLAGPVLTKDMVEWHWSQLRRNLGEQDNPGWVIHALRHTCCTRLLRAGLDVAKVRLWMGHLDIATTMIYSHLVAQDLTEGATILSQYRGA